MIITTPKALPVTIHNRPISASIAVLSFNQPYLVKEMHRQLGSHIVIIDNGSNPPIVDADVFVPENRYFSGGWNYAMPFLEGEWVAMLNDDITGISLPMIYDLIDTAERSGYAAISPAFNSPHAHMQPQGTGLRPVASIDWVAAIIRKDAWNAVGGFNEAFKGYGSDLELSFKLMKKGCRLAVDDRHVIHHIGGAAAVAGGTQHIQGNVTAMNEAFQREYGASDWIDFTNRFLLEVFNG